MGPAGAPQTFIRRGLFLALVVFGAGLARAGPGAWTSGGPYGARVDRLAIDPKTPSTLYATTNGDVFKSIDSGASWAPVISSVAVLAIDPTTPSTLYAVTSSSDLFKSLDSGATWAGISTFLPSRLVSLAIDPITPSTLYAGTYYDGVYKSIDSGATWTAANTGLVGQYTCCLYYLVVDPTTPSTLYAATPYDGVFKSTNAGGTWAPANTGLTSHTVGALVIDPATPSTLYVGTLFNGIFKSTNGGGTWAPTGLATPVGGVAIDPLTPSTLYAWTWAGEVLRSANAGATWTLTNLPANPQAIALAIDPVTPSTLYTGTQVGVFKSTNSGSTWTATNVRLGKLLVNAVVLDPLTPSTLYAGTHGAAVFKSTNSGAQWALASAGLTQGLGDLNVTALAVDPKTPSTLYCGIQYGGVFKSTDGGGSWAPSNTGLTHSEGGAAIPYFVGALAIDPVTPSTIYAGAYGGGIFKSTDAGGTWTAANTGLPPMLPSSGFTVFALAIDPATPSTLYAGVTGGLYKSTSSGATWVRWDLATPVVTALAVDPTTPSTLYAGTAGRVLRSTDSGNTWTQSDPLTSPVSYGVVALAIHPAIPTTLYAAMPHEGVFKSTDSGATWVAVNRGLVGPGNLDVSALALDPTGATTVYAGLADGVWQATPPTALEADLALALSDSPDPLTGTTPLTYTIAVSNNGPGSASAVSVSHTLPVGVTFDTASGSGWTCGESGGVVTCARPSLAIGAGPPVSVQVTPGPAAAVLASSASVSAAQVDPNPTNNFTSENTTVNQALVWLGARTKTVGAGSGRFVSGGDVTYTISLTNGGIAAQTDNAGHELVDALPSSLLLTSATATSGTAIGDLAGNSVVWDGSIPSGGSVTITIHATIEVTVGLDTTLANQGTIHYDADGNGSNEAATPTDDPGKPGANDPTTFVVVSPPLHLYTLPPCRLLDTRDPVGPFGGPALQANAVRVLPLFDRCGIPSTARALSVNLTVTEPAAPGNVRLYPAASPVPNASSINYTAGQTRANNAVVSLDGYGQLGLFCAQASGTAHFILDVNGYFE